MPILRNMVEPRAISYQDIFVKDLSTTNDVNAGTNVTTESGSRLGAAYSCIRILSETVGSLPWDVYRKGSGTVREQVDRVPSWVHSPNPDQTQMEWVEQLVGSLNTTGDGIAQIVRNRDGVPMAFVLWHPNEVNVWRRSSGALVYTFGGKDYRPEDVLHIRAFTWPGEDRGLSPIEWAKQTFGTAIAIDEHGARFFGNGARPGGVLELDTDPGPEGVKRIAKQWQKAHGGVSKSHLPAVLTGGAKYKPITIPNDQAQFLETRKFTRSEIAGIFRVPPHLIGDLERATFSNIEHQGLEFLTYSIRPWLVRIEQRMTMLLPRGQFIKFNPDALLRGDTKSRYEAHAIALQNGIKNLDEVRGDEDLPPLPDGNGRKHYHPLHLGEVGEERPEGTNQNKSPGGGTPQPILPQE